MRRVTPDAVLCLLSVFSGSDPSCTKRVPKSAKQIAASISKLFELPLNKQLTREVDMHLHFIVIGVDGYLMLIENHKLLRDAVERYRERGLHPEANRLETRLEQLR
jgi:hypothetical protein